MHEASIVANGEIPKVKCRVSYVTIVTIRQIVIGA